MEIGKVSQPTEQVVASVQTGNSQQVGVKNEVLDSKQVVQQDFQVNLQDGLKAKLLELVNALQNREQLIKSLPEEIKKAVIELLQQMSSEAELPQGLESLLKGQKNTAEQLKNMSNILDFAAVLNQDEHGDIQAFLQKVLENVKGQSVMAPEQSAKELVQLAKQLSTSTGMTQGNLKQTVEQLVAQTLPENVQQLGSNEQKALAKLTSLLGKDMPVPIQQMVKQNNLTELPGVWSMLKAAEAWQFKDVQPKRLQASADLLRQLAQEMSSSDQMIVVEQLEQFAKALPPEDGKQLTTVTQLEKFVKTLPLEVRSQATTVAQLEQFIKTLPPEIGKSLQQSLQQGNIPDNLQGLADTFSNAAVLHKNMDSDLQSLIKKMVEKIGTQSPSLLTDASQVLTKLAKQGTDTAAVTEQLKNLIKQLKTQLFAGDHKFLANEQSVLDKLTKLFEKNAPQALQEGVVKQKFPELPKIWVLLKALNTEQWQNLESQNLQKSAGVVKELAQSIYKSTGAAVERQAEHSTLSFSVPLHVAEGVYYPAHIHIYHEQNNKSSQSTERQFETWLRVRVDTENIGMVDSVFRLYADNKLDVRVNFSNLSAANQFAQDVSNIRKSISDTKLNLTDIMINKA